MLLCDKFEPLFKLLNEDNESKKIRYVILIGGRGGAKSYALEVFTNQATYKKGWGVLFTRWTMKSAEKSVIPEFKEIAGEDALNNAGDFSFKQTQVVNNMSGTVVDFCGLKPNDNQSTGALKSLSKKNVFILEEAEDCHDFEIFDKVDNSIRTIKHHNLVILCLNQGHKNHWIYTEYVKPYLNGERDDVLYIETTYLDNIKYLNQSFIDKAEKIKARDLSRYKHIYLNDWQSDTDGAIWKQSDISVGRIKPDEFEDIKNTLIEIIVSFDPAVTDYEKKEKERQEARNKGKEPDEDGIMIMGKDRRGHIYLWRDLSMRGKRSDVAKEIVGAYKDELANVVVVEVNNGGDWIKNSLKAVDRAIDVEKVTATRGKAIRANPAKAFYEENMVHHVGHFPELEHEMTNWVPDTGMDSPNRVDALVWGITYLIQEEVAVYSGGWN